MTETEIKTEDQKTKISKLAIASLILAIPVFVMAIATLFIHRLVIDMPGFAKILLLMLTLASIVLTFLSLHLINKCKDKMKGKNLAVAVLIFVYSSFLLLHMIFSGTRIDPLYVFCNMNLRHLKVAIDIYCHENDGMYPIAEKWCDLLKDYHVEDQLICPAKSRKVERCSYAINPNCEPNSPAEVVLLFETQGGWNQHGGPELLSSQNHPEHKNDFWGYKISGCNVMFNDGHVEFVPQKRFTQLKWKTE